MHQSPAARYIRGTAVRFSDLGTFALPLPATHDAVRNMVRDAHGDRVGKHQGQDGFVTSDGTFLSAREALVVARQARQLRRGSVRSLFLKPENLLKLDLETSPNGAPLTPNDQSDVWQPPTGIIQRSGTSRVKNGLASPRQLRLAMLKSAALGVAITLLLTSAIFYLARPVLLVGWDRLLPNISDVHLALLSGGFSIAAGIAVGLVINAEGARYRRSAMLTHYGALGIGCLWALSTRAFPASAPDWLLVIWIISTVVAVSLFGTVRSAAAALLSLKFLWLAVVASAVWLN